MISMLDAFKGHLNLHARSGGMDDFTILIPVNGLFQRNLWKKYCIAKSSKQKIRCLECWMTVTSECVAEDGNHEYNGVR
jgi:hypothetical protein